MLIPGLFHSCGPGRHDRGDLQQDEEGGVVAAGPQHLGAVEGAAMTRPGQHHVDVAPDESAAGVQEQAATALNRRNDPRRPRG